MTKDTKHPVRSDEELQKALAYFEKLGPPLLDPKFDYIPYKFYGDKIKPKYSRKLTYNPRKAFK